MQNKDEKELTMKTSPHAEATTIYRATVTDTISRERIGRFSYSADSIEEARERGWRIAGVRFGNDIHVKIERISK